MPNTHLTLRVLSVALVLMLVAVYGHAGAQTVASSENVMKGGRIAPKVITLINTNGNVVRSTDSGRNWKTVESESVDNIRSSLQLAKRQMVAPAMALNVTVSPNPTAGAT